MNELLKLSDIELEQTLCPSPITPDSWTFTGKEIKEAILGERLLNVSIDLTNDCNLNCPYCFTAPANSRVRDKDEGCLSFEEYKDLIIQLKQSGTRTINIVGAGEPTMYKYFDELVQFIAEQGMKVGLSTNGILLSSQDRKIDLLNEIKATIVLKVNSRNSHLQDVLVGRNGYATLRDRTLNKLIKKGFNAEVPTRLAINTLLIKSIYYELYDIFKFSRENNMSFIASVYMPTGRTSGLVFHGQEAIQEKFHVLDDLYQPLNEIEIEQLLDLFKKYDAKFGITRSPHPAYISGIACTQLLGFQIDNKGKIWSCPARKLIVDHKIEDIYISEYCTLDLLSLWNEDKLKDLRNEYNGECIYKGIINKY